MPVAAVPKYIQERDPEFYLSAPPGHRFLLYFPAWGENLQTGRIDWRMKDRVPRIDKKTKQQKESKQGPEWEDVPNDQFACTVAACKMPAFDEERPRARKPKVDPSFKLWRLMMESLLRRQEILADAIRKDALLRLPDVRAIAPFTTGLGNEHPLENGFAFLNPYGLPYLPGSGVKGVLRQAARELASGEWGDTQGWSNVPYYWIEVERKHVKLSLHDVLFGFQSKEGEKEHVRAALSFWDVIPQINGDSLMVEIMTPHQSHYYQIDKKENPSPPHFQSPHDSGQPNPISFLTVPPGSGFPFHVVCDLAYMRRLTRNKNDGAPDLSAEGRTHWKTMIEAAFRHAFQWLGFGAKTAVGYGAMKDRVDAGTEMQASASAEERPKHAPASRRSQSDSAQTVWERARLKFNANNGTLTAVGPNNVEAYALPPRGLELLASLPGDVQRMVRTNQFVRVVARVRGSELIAIETRPPA